jgi:translation initiation factor 1A
MPKNKIGGKNFKKGKKGAGLDTERTLLQKTEGQAYALVTKLNGNSMINCRVFSDPDSSGNFNSRDVVGIIRPGLKKKRIFINANNVILVCLRDFEPGKVDVVYSYKIGEVRKLHKMGKIPSNCMAFCGDDEKGDQDETALFQYEESDSSDSDDPQTEKVVKRGKTVKKKKVDNNEPYLQLPDDFGASLSEEEELEEVPTDYTSYSQKPDKSCGNDDLDIDNI